MFQQVQRLNAAYGDTTYTNKVYSHKEKGRHWSSESQLYAPSDVLLSHLRCGWVLDSEARAETFYYSGSRQVHVITFTLHHTNREQSLDMPVIVNPVVFRLIADRNITVVNAN